MPHYRQDQLSLNFPRISIRQSSGPTMKVSSFCGLAVTQTTAANALSRLLFASHPDVTIERRPGGITKCSTTYI